MRPGVDVPACHPAFRGTRIPRCHFFDRCNEVCTRTEQWGAKIRMIKTLHLLSRVGKVRHQVIETHGWLSDLGRDLGRQSELWPQHQGIGPYSSKKQRWR